MSITQVPQIRFRLDALGFPADQVSWLERVWYHLAREANADTTEVPE